MYFSKVFTTHTCSQKAVRGCASIKCGNTARQRMLKDPVVSEGWHLTPVGGLADSQAVKPEDGKHQGRVSPERSLEAFFFLLLLCRAAPAAHGGSQPAYTTATTTQDPSHLCSLQHSSRPCWILSPLSKARDRTCDLMVPRWICFHCTMTGTPSWGLWTFWEIFFSSKEKFGLK